jgi:hypothetical protein
MKKIFITIAILLFATFAIAGQNDRFADLELVDVTATADEINALDGLTGGILTETSTSTLTNKTLTSPVINTGVSGTAVLDEDDMASDSATQLVTQQSLAAFVNAAFVAADDGLTVDNDANIAGLASAIVLADSIKVTINLHYADATEHTSGVQAAISSSDATDLASILALTGEMLTSYAAHDDDAILASTWLYHVAQGTEKALASDVTPTTLIEAITRLNDLKAKLNDHMDDAAAHTDGDSAQEAASDAAMGAAVDVVVSGAVTGSLVMWSILDNGTGNVTGVSGVAGTDKVTFTFSATPQADTIISYLVIRDNT